MKNYILLFSSLLLFKSAGTVFAQNEDRIEEIKTEIEQKKSEIESLEKELSSLLPEDDSNEFEISTNNAVYIFTNPRFEDDNLLLNLDYENISNENLSLWGDMSFDLMFEQEDENNVYSLSFDFNHDYTDGDYTPLTMDTKIKAGGVAKLIVVLTEADPLLDTFVRNSSFSSQSGEAEEIKIDLP